MGNKPALCGNSNTNSNARVRSAMAADAACELSSDATCETGRAADVAAMKRTDVLAVPFLMSLNFHILCS